MVHLIRKYHNFRYLHSDCIVFPFPFSIFLSRFFCPSLHLHYRRLLHTVFPYFFHSPCQSFVLWEKEEIWLSPMTEALTPTEKSKKQRDNTKNATKNFDYTTIADRLRTVSWGNDSHPAGVLFPEVTLVCTIKFILYIPLFIISVLAFVLTVQFIECPSFCTELFFKSSFSDSRALKFNPRTLCDLHLIPLLLQKFVPIRFITTFRFKLSFLFRVILGKEWKSFLQAMKPNEKNVL